MIAETLGRSLAEVDELSLEEIATWNGWFTHKANEEKKARRRAQAKSRRSRRR